MSLSSSGSGNSNKFTDINKSSNSMELVVKNNSWVNYFYSHICRFIKNTFNENYPVILYYFLISSIGSEIAVKLFKSMFKVDYKYKKVI